MIPGIRYDQADITRFLQLDLTACAPLGIAVHATNQLTNELRDYEGGVGVDGGGRAHGLLGSRCRNYMLVAEHDQREDIPRSGWLMDRLSRVFGLLDICAHAAWLLDRQLCVAPAHPTPCWHELQFPLTDETDLFRAAKQQLCDEQLPVSNGTGCLSCNSL